MPSITERFKSAWNAFNGRESFRPYVDVGTGSSYRPDKNRIFFSGDQSIVKAISNRIAIDVAAMTIEHVRLDEEKNFKESINSSLNECLNLSANIDQTGRAFIQDAVESMFDEGVVALVPTDITFKSSGMYSPEDTESYSIDKLRVGKIVEWYPQHVKVRLYNELNGRQEEVIVKKTFAAIVTNPLYSIMNEPNSTLQRLIRTFNDLDLLNAQNSSGKLNLVIQLPYTVKTPLKEQQADHRRQLIEEQLADSKYGIAYIDGTEKITQLNRPLENNLWTQAKDLTQMLYNQLGLTQAIFDGTADEATMLNYQNRTVEPVLAAFIDEMKRKFLSKTARSQGQSIIYFRDPFRLVPVQQLAEIADKFTRNEILSPNEVRSEIGYKPSSDPKADELRNRNINQNNVDAEAQVEEGGEVPDITGMSDEEAAEAITNANGNSEASEEQNDDEIDELIKLLSGE